MPIYPLRSSKRRRVIVVTGASAGVGRAIVREFGKEKAKIGLIARDMARLKTAQQEIEKMGGEGVILPLDVSNPKALQNAAQEVEETFGPIDVWINNAMVSVFSPVQEMTPEEYKRVTEVTYLGYVYGTLEALKRMKPRNRGIIIQIGSALAYRSIPLQSAYCAAKHAISGFTESLRTELLHDHSKVQVCQVNLPAVNTPQFDWVKSRSPHHPKPVPPIYQPELIAHAVRHVSLHPRRRLDIAFPTLKAVLAEKFVPGLADLYLSRNGYSSQQTNQPVSPTRKDNLWNFVPGSYAARGKFSSESRNFSFTLWLNLHRMPLSIVTTALLGLGFIWKQVSGRNTIEKVFPEEKHAA